jgi:trehalose/maltose hydrolase-like predicted phosphorylase
MAHLNRPSNERLHRTQVENLFVVPTEARISLQRTSDPNWVLVEEGLTLAREHEIESLLAIGNGHVGTRASLEEGSELSAPATFVAGVFEHPNVPGAVPELAVLPDWAGIKVWVNECPLKMQEGSVLEHRRILDFKQGVLWREWRHRDVDGRITRFNSLRLTSLANRKLLLQWILLTAENYSPVLCLESSIKLGPDIQPLLPPNWQPATSPELPNFIPLVLHDADGRLKAVLCIASQLLARCTKDCKRRVEIKSDSVVEKICLHADAGTQCELYRFVAVHKAGTSEKPLEDAQEQLENTSPRTLWTAAAAHASVWRQRWETADVQIEGDYRLQQALRFAIYHLISAANPEDNQVSIGARALTGEAYKGHVFWDTEIYMLPFYIYTHPASARSLLEYRHYTLAAARNKARAAGYRGAMYAWESADTGEDVTPLAIITPAGEVLQVRNGELEVHITADVAYAVWQYWKATGDDEFFLHYGAEIMLESARFWASRGKLEADGIYHIRHVIGPDEYHEDVDDNTYTNLLAAWNLRRGAETAAVLNQRWRDRWRELAAGLVLTEEEVALWPKLADVMATGFDPQTLLFEQFSGYFKKEQIDLKAYEPRSAAMDVILGHKRLQQTNIVKQPDVIMAIYLLWEDFPADVRAANFHYYEPRTAHGSSLSPSIHALIAARLGDMETAQRYLKQSAEIDLGNAMGNAAGGVHAAALGGLWQAAIFGFAGVRAGADELKLVPNLLPDWRRISFPIRWRDCIFRISIEPETARVVVEGEKPLKLRLADGPEILAEPRQEYVSRREKQSWSAWQPLNEQ